MPAQEQGKVDLNEATVDELEAIPGIGRTRAEAIVSYREENGPFGSLEDVKQVSGISETLMELIAESATLGRKAA